MFIRLVRVASITVPAFLAGIAGVVAAQDRRGSGDYLSQELRARVDVLVEEASVPTEDVDELISRFRTLWEWGNAYARERGRIPDDFPQNASYLNRALRGLAGQPVPVDRVAELIDSMVRQLQVTDEAPGALGSLTISSGGPFPAEGTPRSRRPTPSGTGRSPRAAASFLARGGETAPSPRAPQRPTSSPSALRIRTPGSLPSSRGRPTRLD